MGSDALSRHQRLKFTLIRAVCSADPRVPLGRIRREVSTAVAGVDGTPRNFGLGLTRLLWCRPSAWDAKASQPADGGLQA